MAMLCLHNLQVVAISRFLFLQPFLRVFNLCVARHSYNDCLIDLCTVLLQWSYFLKTLLVSTGMLLLFSFYDHPFIRYSYLCFWLAPKHWGRKRKNTRLHCMVKLCFIALYRLRIITEFVHVCFVVIILYYKVQTRINKPHPLLHGDGTGFGWRSHSSSRKTSRAKSNLASFISRTTDD